MASELLLMQLGPLSRGRGLVSKSDDIGLMTKEVSSAPYIRDGFDLELPSEDEHKKKEKRKSKNG